MQEREIGDASRVAHHGLAIDGRLLRQPEHSVADQRIAIRPVIATSGEQPHSPAVDAGDQPVAVMFDLVNPLGPTGGLVASAGMQGAINP